MVKVSIIVPVYKVEKYLDRCVSSLIAQTLSEIEIILVDDGSPDACPQMCDDWAARDSRIRVIHKENAGLGFARNSGMEVATGEFVGFVDSDDYVDSDMYEKLYDAAKSHQAQLAMTGFCCIGGIMASKENDVRYINCFDRETVFREKDGIDELLLNICGSRPEEYEDSKYGFSSVKNIYQRSVITENNIAFLSERDVMSEDVFFVLDFICKIQCAVGVEGAHYKYCRNGESLSKSYRANRFESCKLLIQKMNAVLECRMDQSVFRMYTDRLFQAYVRTACMQEIQFAKQNALTRKQLKERLRAMHKSTELQTVLKRYPWGKLPLKQAIFAMTMRYSMVSLQKLLVNLKSRG